jgi:predicted alpha/beta-hydrolase family hydrolase
MRRSPIRFSAVWLLALGLAACSTSGTPTQPATPIDTAAPSAPTADLTATVFEVTQPDLIGAATEQMPSATPNPTDTSPPADTPLPSATPLEAGRPVTIPVTSGVELAGTLYGEGEVAVVFSNMGDQHEAAWAPVARAMSAAGYLALTYEFRYWVNGRMDADQVQFIADDLRAAARFAREQGAEQVVLVGASLGGMATAKSAADAGAVAVVILAAPMQAPGVDVAVSVEELQAILAPKLFITSEFDDTVAPEALEAMYAQAVEPKQLFVYAGTSAHGTHLLQTEHADDLRARLLEFVAAHSGGAP